MDSRSLYTEITRPAVKENANYTREEDKKITSSCLLFKNKRDNSIPFYQKSANVQFQAVAIIQVASGVVIFSPLG